MKRVYFDRFSISEQGNNKELIFHDSLNDVSYSVDYPNFSVEKEFGTYYVFCFFIDINNKINKLVYHNIFQSEDDAEVFSNHMQNIVNNI